MLIGNAETDSAPSPLLPAFGLTLPIIDDSLLVLEAGVLTFGTYYRYSGGRAAPVELEQLGFWVQGLLLDSRIGIRWRISKTFALGAKAGAVLLIRVPIPLFADVQDEFGGIFGYFYAMARFIYPETEIFTRFTITEDFDLNISIRAYYPLFHLWDGETLSFFDQFMLGGFIGLVYKLK